MITFDGEPTIEMDYQASQVHIVYSLVNKKYANGDPYLPPMARPMLRPVYKALLLRSFTFSNPVGSVWNDEEINTVDLNLTEMLDEIWEIHHHINDFRHKKAHKVITFEESRVALKVIELCNEQGITVLPIHDSFIVKKKHMQTLEKMMVKSYEALGFVSVPRVL